MAKQDGSSSFDETKGVVADSFENIYGRITQGTLDSNLNEGNSIFLVKYDSTGNRMWTKQLGTDSIDVANDVAIDSSGNIFAGSNFGKLDGNDGVGTETDL